MAKELKTFVLNLKSLDQQIPSPILAGAGDANGRTFRIVFTQEAADMFTQYTKVYLKWYHQEEKTRGYNVFQKMVKEEDFLSPQIWELKLPRMMLYEGNAVCTIEIVDEYSISPSSSFLIHVTADPYDSAQFEATDDFTVFQQAAIEMNSAVEKANQQFEDHAERFGEIETLVDSCKETSDRAYTVAKEALNRVNDFAAEGLGLYMNEIN